MADSGWEAWPESSGPLSEDSGREATLAARESAWRIRHGPDPALDAIERTLAAEQAADQFVAADLTRLEGALNVR
jgi:hypothetical protein